jgi:hypothetical protein
LQPPRGDIGDKKWNEADSSYNDMGKVFSTLDYLENHTP